MNSLPSLGRALRQANCQIACDNLTRQLYATDASLYRLEPAAVAFPRNAAEVRAAISAAAEANLSVTPRGAGTGLVGGALGDGLVIDLCRFNRQISDFDLERQCVRVGSGVVLDQLEEFLRRRGFRFGPDVATSSRATLGGMIANNSSGSHAPVYGTTTDHVIALEVVLADGGIQWIGADRDGWKAKEIEELVRPYAAEIKARMPDGLSKRWPGFALDHFLREPNQLSHLLAGSEGTLAAITAAELRIVPLPKAKGLGLIFFSSLAEAMQTTVELLDLKPAAIEHIDRVLFDQTKGQPAFQGARDLLGLDSEPCESILIVEFFDEVDERLAALEKRKLGRRRRIMTEPLEMNLVWALRKAGLSLLTGRKGDAKPVTGVEDAAVRPRDLPDYVGALQGLFGRLGLEACFYGHAASGLLHVRPVLDLRSPADLEKFRQVADEVSALVRQFNGSLAAEHGVGMARTEYIEAHLGPSLVELMRQIKRIFDPPGMFNPGKILGGCGYRIDHNLRLGHELELPFATKLAFAAKDQSFIRNLDQCNGCGGCRKETPTMCPTFLATGDELMSTRGRANLIRAVLEGRHRASDALLAEELDAALSACLSCKACSTECPSNVNMALLKAELLHARHQKFGASIREKLVGSVDLIGKLGCLAPGLANAFLRSRVGRRLLETMLGLAQSRPLPAFADEPFDRWFARRARSRRATGGPVLLWDDTFVRYYEPNVGRAAVEVLERAGHEVILAGARRCCGRPAFSQGLLDKAARLGRHNLDLIENQFPDVPIVFLEPSCFSMFAEDYRELKLEGAAEAARRCFLFEEFIGNLLERAPGALAFAPVKSHLAIHAHCHAKALRNPNFMLRLAQRLPLATTVLLETGCCGMAGAFGALSSKYDLSIKIGRLLARQIERQPPGRTVIASGASCRHQIEHLTGVTPKHFAEILAENLER